MQRRLTLKDHQEETRFFAKRTLAIAIIIALLCLLLLGQLVNLQIVQHDRYITLSNNNHLDLIPIKPDRGLIYDRNGVVLADNTPVFSLELNVSRIPDLRTTIAELQKLITITPDQITAFNKLKSQHRAYESIPLRLDLNDQERALIAVNQYRWPGVSISVQMIRNYPQKAYLSHVLGYVSRINEKELAHVDPVNYSATNFIGKLGIEKYYESVLHGRVGYQRVEIDASGRVVRVLQRAQPTAGHNIKLTLDNALQQHIHNALGNHRGAAVVIDPRNGEVLALVSTPSFDPNPFVRGISTTEFKALHDSPFQPLYNRAIRGQYPLASTIKPFIALQGLDGGTIDTEFSIPDPGWFRLPNSRHVYRDWKKGGHGRVNIHRAIMVSCDTFYYTLANRMGIAQIHDILTQFGFGARTQIDLPEELSGIVPNEKWKRTVKHQPWYPGDTLISGIGQGFMLTTPLQLAQGVATLSQRGQRIRPHLLLQQITPEQVSVDYQHVNDFPVTLQHDNVWDIVIEAMRDVIRDNGGTGYNFGRDAPYEVAAKTGTAQVFSAKFHEPLSENSPEHLRDHSLFIAFAPVQQPRVAVAVIVENSAIAATIARQTLDFILLPKRSLSKASSDEHH